MASASCSGIQPNLSAFIYFNGLDHASLVDALALPLQNSTSVLSDIAGFLERHANNQRSG